MPGGRRRLIPIEDHMPAKESDTRSKGEMYRHDADQSTDQSHTFSPSRICDFESLTLTRWFGVSQNGCSSVKTYFSCRSTIAQTLLALVLFSAAGSSAVKAATFGPEATKEGSQRTLTFAERVAYQRTVEEVYWRHRIWPKENPRPKPSLDEVMSQGQIEQKVEEYLRNSQLLTDQWQKSITPDQLQAEMDRMASHTRQPDLLRELFAALGNDPFIVAECLARPLLSERLVDELHAGSNPVAETESLQSQAAKMETESSVPTEQPASGYYLPEIASSPVEDPGGAALIIGAQPAPLAHLMGATFTRRYGLAPK